MPVWTYYQILISAEKDGMINLHEGALKEVMTGITTVEELLCLTFEERIDYYIG
ncbi:MAG: hypothetical protein AB1567_03000 [bacterium]